MGQEKYSIFGFELAQIPEEMRILGNVVVQFAQGPHGAHTLFQTADDLDAAAQVIDSFKARNCGSAYNLAVLNLNELKSDAELDFLLSGEVLGQPRTLFLAHLRHLQGPIYAVARAKVERESELIFSGTMGGAPSCLISYTPATLEAMAVVGARILTAHLEDIATHERTKQTGMIPPFEKSKAMAEYRSLETIFFGRSLSSKTGVFRKLSSQTASSSEGPASN